MTIMARRLRVAGTRHFHKQSFPAPGANYRRGKSWIPWYEPSGDLCKEISRT